LTAKINNVPSAFTLIDSDSDNFPYDDNTIPGLVAKDTDSKVVIPIGQYRRNTADQWETLRLAKTETLQDEVSATGDGIDFNVEGYGTVTLYISGSFVATVTFKASIDGTNFEDYPAMNKSTGEIATTATTTGLYEINCRGLKEIRASVTWTSGTSITIAGYAEIFSSSDIENIYGLKTRIGQISDALVDAGATGSLSAKLRRISTDLDTLMDMITDVWDDTNNVLGTKIIGIKDSDGTYGIATSYTLDSNGYPVQRVVDAAPFAYDSVNDVKYVEHKFTEGAVDSAVPTKALFVGGKYSSSDPTYHNGDLTPVRTNVKGEIITEMSGSTSSYIIPMFDLLAWSGFTNQPANDGVEIVSDSASDVGKCTIFGTTHGTGAFAYETVTLTGTTPKATVKTDWGNVYGVFLGDIDGTNITPAVGTITIREASADQTITTIVATKISNGMVVFNLTGKQIILNVHSGNVWKRCAGVVTTANGFKLNLTGGNIKEEKIASYIYLISDTSGATAQIEVMA